MKVTIQKPNASIEYFLELIEKGKEVTVCKNIDGTYQVSYTEEATHYGERPDLSKTVLRTYCK